jgi:hypothetical protein
MLGHSSSEYYKPNRPHRTGSGRCCICTRTGFTLLVKRSGGTVRGTYSLETYCGVPQPFWKTQRSPFWYLKPSPEIIRLAVMLFVRHSLSLPNVEDLLHKPGIKICPETVRFWWNRFGLCSSAKGGR